jgi:hypothetical protein
MGDLLVNRKQWIAITTGTKPMGTSNEDWKKLKGKARSTIWHCLTDFISLNVLEEETTETS